MDGFATPASAMKHFIEMHRPLWDKSVWTAQLDFVATHTTQYDPNTEKP